MLAPRRFPLFLLPAAVLACGDARVVESAQDPEPETVAEDGCAHWLLVERNGNAPNYERRVYDERARIVRRDTGNAARSLSGELHSVIELSYGEGLVTSESMARDSLQQENVHTFTEVTELDALGRPVRILGWDSDELPEPNRTLSHEYDTQGRLSVRHQQDNYANGGLVDRRCTFEYDTSGQLVAKRCEGTNPDSKRYGWDEAGNLLFSELEAETFTSRSEYAYEGTRLVSYLWGGFSRHEFAYDEEGRLVWHEHERFDGLGAGLHEYEYDAAGRMLQHISMDLDGSVRDTTSFRFDAAGRLVEEASGRTPRSYSYEESSDELTVTERWGDEVFETRHYLCSATPTTGLPVDTNPEPFGGRDPSLPQETVEPRPFPDAD
ncbi:MAG: hypothetical protein KUG77_27730 [Nannocystaceae bacterium]|nr:hypothetical protein [Nannocystaceae bacterium]